MARTGGRWPLDAPERAPADFTAFVATHAARIRTACRSLSANDRLVEGVQRELFATVALRWWWLSRQPRGRRARTAAAHLDRVFRREARQLPARGHGSRRRIRSHHGRPVRAGPRPARGRRPRPSSPTSPGGGRSRTRNRRRIFAAVAILADRQHRAPGTAPRTIHIGGSHASATVLGAGERDHRATIREL